MSIKERVIHRIYNVIDEVNDQYEKDKQLEKSLDTVLFGKGGKLDSLGLVHLIVATEEKIEDEFEIAITIADEKAISQRRGPFKTIGSLADYVVALLEETVSNISASFDETKINALIAAKTAFQPNLEEEVQNAINNERNLLKTLKKT